MCTLSEMHHVEYTCGTVCIGYGKYLCTKCSSRACSLHVHVCAHWRVTVFPLPEGKMTGERRMLQQQPASEGRRGGKEETEMGSAAVGLGRGKIGRRVMIGWYRTEERMRGVQRGWKKEERNERRARERLQMGWDWQRRDGSLERRRE